MICSGHRDVMSTDLNLGESLVPPRIKENNPAEETRIQREESFSEGFLFSKSCSFTRNVRVRGRCQTHGGAFLLAEGTCVKHVSVCVCVQQEVSLPQRFHYYYTSLNPVTFTFAAHYRRVITEDANQHNKHTTDAAAKELDS